MLTGGANYKYPVLNKMLIGIICASLDLKKKHNFGYMCRNTSLQYFFLQ